MLDALVTAVDNKDRYTRKHSEDVVTYSLMIARELGFDKHSQQIDAIPLIAQLMPVADAYSAMTTNRPNRQGMDRQHALDILEQGAGTQCDPICVKAFESALQADQQPDLSYAA